MHQPGRRAQSHDQHVDEQRRRRSLPPTLWSHGHPSESQRTGQGGTEPQAECQASPSEQVRPDTLDDPSDAGPAPGSRDHLAEDVQIEIHTHTDR